MTAKEYLVKRSVSRLLAGTKGYGLFSGDNNAEWGVISRKNHLINGDFRVVQRGSNVIGVDDTYQAADRWITLQDTGTGPSVRSDNVSLSPPSLGGGYFDICISGGGSNKFGRMQIIESQDMYHLRGGTVSLGFNLYTTSVITDVRAAVLSWSGTADTVTSDPVSSWEAAGTNPTLVASWAYANTPSNVRTADSTWARVKIEGMTVPSNANNLAVVIWNNDTTHTLNVDFFAVNDVQLEEGAICTRFERRPIGEELALCLRYTRILGANGNGTYNAATRILVSAGFEIPMRAAPTATLLSTAFQILDVGVGFQTGAASAIVGSSLHPRGVYLDISGFTGLTAGSEIRVVSADIVRLEAEL